MANIPVTLRTLETSINIIQKLIKKVVIKKKLLSGNFFDVVNVACGKKNTIEILN